MRCGFFTSSCRGISTPSVMLTAMYLFPNACLSGASTIVFCFLIVEYAYLPPSYDVNSKIGSFETDIPKSLLIYGLCAEYCICTGAFDEAVLWHDRYVDAVKDARKVRNCKIKGRCWA